jgi:hypothetical protein
MRAAFAKHHPRGQAALEVLLIMIFGFMLVLAIHHIGQLRTVTLDLLGESHFLSFVPAKIFTNKSLSAGTPRLGVQNFAVVPFSSTRFTDDYSTVLTGGSPYSRQQRDIENQLGFDSTSLLRASAHSAPRLRSGLPTLGLSVQTRFVRHSFLLSGYGDADSTQAAQRQIAGSAKLWQNGFSRSQPLVNESAITFQNIDRPWSRPSLTADWLLPWVNEVLGK